MADENRETHSLQDLVYVLFRHKGKILLVFFATLLTVVIGTLQMAPTYEATTSILLKRDEPGQADLSLNGRFLRLGQEEEINSELEIIKSFPVMGEVVRRHSLHQVNQVKGKKGFIARLRDLVKQRLRISSPPPKEAGRFERAVIRLRERIKAEPTKKSNVINISYQGRDPVLVASVANTVAEVYLDYRLKVHQSSKADAFFEEQIAVAKERLEKLENQLESFREAEGMASYETQESLILDKLGSFDRALTEVKKNIISKQARLGKMKLLFSSGSEELLPTSDMGDDRVVATLRTKLVDLELKRKALADRYTDQHQEVKNLDREIQQTRDVLSDQIRKLIRAEEASLAVAAAERNALEVTVAGLSKETRELPQKELIISRLSHDIRDNKEIYSLLVRKREEVRIVDASDRRVANISIVSPATVPVDPVRPRMKSNLLLAIILGGTAGLGLAFISEYVKQTFTSAEDVEYFLNLPVLASIPKMKKGQVRSPQKRHN